MNMKIFQSSRVSEFPLKLTIGLIVWVFSVITVFVE